jgi:glycosyltransferase involved in cell wall biosynthesis
MRALVFEPQFVGHNLAYARHVLTALIDQGIETTLLTSRQATESEEFQSHLSSLSPNFKLAVSHAFETKKSTRGIRVQGPGGLFATMRSLLDGLKSFQPNHVIVPFANPLAHALGVPNPISALLRKRNIEIEGILLFGRYAYPHTDLASKCKQHIALKMLERGPWSRLHHILPHAVRMMENHSPHLREVVSFLPDPIESPIHFSRDSACDKLGLNPNHRYVSLVGLIEQRKGVFELLHAARSLDHSLPETTKFLLAGRCTEQVRSALRDEFYPLIQKQRVVVLDKHLAQDELWAACYASSLMTLPYPQHQNSASLLIRAAAAGVPVLCNAIGWMHETTQQYGLGWTCDTRNAKSFVTTLQNCLPICENYSTTPLAMQFVQEHALENFQAKLVQRILSRITAQRSAYR